MIDLNDIAIFAKVAQLESFSRAARALGMPVSTVSRRVTVLEEQLGATLLQRTTRKLNLTPQGRAYFTQCSAPLGELYDAERALTQVQRKPEGLLRVSVPVTIGQESSYEFISSFLRTYPRIQIDLFVTNVFLDLIAENIDVALRYGELRDSTLIAQRIGKSVRYLVCTPGYLDGRNPPSKPDDLREHQCVLLNGRNNEAEWELVSGRKSIRVPVSGPVSARDHHALSAFTYRGHGIGLLPSTFCDARIARGELIRLLPEWSSPENLHSHGLPHAPVPAVQAPGLPGGVEGLEEPALDSAAVMGPADTGAACAGARPDSYYRRRLCSGDEPTKRS